MSDVVAIPHCAIWHLKTMANAGIGLIKLNEHVPSPLYANWCDAHDAKQILLEFCKFIEEVRCQD